MSSAAASVWSCATESDSDAEPCNDQKGGNPAALALPALMRLGSVLKRSSNHKEAPNATVMKSPNLLSRMSDGIANLKVKDGAKEGTGATDAGRDLLSRMSSSLSELSDGMKMGKGANIMDRVEKLAKPFWDAAQHKGVADDMMVAVTGVAAKLMHGDTAEKAMGMLLFGFMYLLAWTKGFADATASVETDLSAVSIIVILLWALISTWFMIFMLAVGLLILDKVVVAALAKDMWTSVAWAGTMGRMGDRNPSFEAFFAVPKAVTIAFSWLFNGKLLTALGMSMVLTLAFAIVYVKWMKMRKADLTTRRMVVRDVFVFNLVTTIAMSVGQLWIDHWWEGPALVRG